MSIIALFEASNFWYNRNIENNQSLLADWHDIKFQSEFLNSALADMQLKYQLARMLSCFTAPFHIKQVKPFMPLVAVKCVEF